MRLDTTVPYRAVRLDMELVSVAADLYAIDQVGADKRTELWSAYWARMAREEVEAIPSSPFRAPLWEWLIEGRLVTVDSSPKRTT